MVFFLLIGMIGAALAIDYFKSVRKRDFHVTRLTQDAWDGLSENNAKLVA